MPESNHSALEPASPVATAMSQNVPKCLTFDDSCEVLSDRQRAALELLLSGASDTDVANAAAVSRRTIYRWRVLDKYFRDELERCRHELFQSTTDRLRATLSNAVGVLDRQARDVYAPTAHRAARTLLTLARIGQAVAESSGYGARKRASNDRQAERKDTHAAEAG